MTHTIPNPFGVTLPAMVVLTVNKVVFVVHGLFFSHPHPAVRTVNILNVFFFHENPKNKSEFSAFATFSRPLKNVQICSSSRKAKILTADIH
jgi:hypothetical protein